MRPTLAQCPRRIDEARRLLTKNLELPPSLWALIHLLESQGVEIWLVGGVLRDCLLGRSYQDYDLAGKLQPEELPQLLSGSSFRPLPSGRKHGSWTIVAEDGSSYELTAFRQELGYSDGRHPDQLNFGGSVETDSGRRDFTVNALYYHPERGLVDPQGGLEDLALRRLRAIGQADVRFREDALRLLRALRFCLQLDFKLEAETGRAILDLAPLIQGLSVERLAAELGSLLATPAPLTALESMPSVYFRYLLRPWAAWPQEDTKDRPSSSLASKSLAPLPSRLWLGALRELCAVEDALAQIPASWKPWNHSWGREGEGLALLRLSYLCAQLRCALDADLGASSAAEFRHLLGYYHCSKRQLRRGLQALAACWAPPPWTGGADPAAWLYSTEEVLFWAQMERRFLSVKRSQQQSVQAPLQFWEQPQQLEAWRKHVKSELPRPQDLLAAGCPPRRIRQRQMEALLETLSTFEIN